MATKMVLKITLASSWIASNRSHIIRFRTQEERMKSINSSSSNQHPWLWRQKLATIYEIIIECPKATFNYKHCVYLATSNRYASHVIRTSHYVWMQNDERESKKKAKKRAYDAQTRKKINKHAVAAITVLPTALYHAIHINSNNNTEIKYFSLCFYVSFWIFANVPFRYIATFFFALFVSMFIALIVRFDPCFQSSRSYPIGNLNWNTERYLLLHIVEWN